MMQRTQLKKLIQHAYRLGATDVAIVSATDIVVDDNLAELCREPGCEHYGLSKSCPPHVSGPLAFRKQLEKYDQAIFFKIDVPSRILYSSDPREIFQLLHEVGAGIEHFAIKMGFAKAQAFAGGSCKDIFCHDHPECLAISGEGKCRNPRYARPSMSGFGINVTKLTEKAGWLGSEGTHYADSATTKMVSIFGLILIGF